MTNQVEENIVDDTTTMRLFYPFSKIKDNNKNVKFIKSMFEAYLKFLTNSDPIVLVEDIRVTDDNLMYINFNHKAYGLTKEQTELGAILFNSGIDEFMLSDRLGRGETGITPNIGGLNRADWYIKYGILDHVNSEISKARKTGYKKDMMLEAYSSALSYDVDKYLSDKPMTRFKLRVNKITNRVKKLLGK